MYFYVFRAFHYVKGQFKIMTGKGAEIGDDMQQRAAGWNRTQATAKDSACFG